MKERGLGFARVFELFSDGQNDMDLEAMARIGGCSVRTARRWRDEVIRRKAIFQQEPNFDEHGKFLGWIEETKI